VKVKEKVEDVVMKEEEKEEEKKIEEKILEKEEKEGDGERERNKEKEGGKEVYCFCRQPQRQSEFMIACDQCNEWFHGVCLGLWTFFLYLSSFACSFETL